MKLLNLNQNCLNNVGAQYLSKCIHQIEELQLQKCDIHEEGVKALAERINRREEPVKNFFSSMQKLTKFNA